jgi:hypothetical protein
LELVVEEEDDDDDDDEDGIAGVIEAEFRQIGVRVIEDDADGLGADV